jgi:hypothetical protein
MRSMVNSEGQCHDAALGSQDWRWSPAVAKPEEALMELHDTANAQNTHLGARARFGRRAVPVALAAALAVIVGLSLSGTVTASNDDGHRGCSNRTLRGDYGILVSGSRPLGPGVVETFTGTAVRTYDGHGQFTQLDSTFGSITGFQKEVPAYGTYEVRTNCSGTSLIFFPGAPAPVETAFVIVAQGDEVKDAAAFSTTASLWRVGR